MEKIITFIVLFIIGFFINYYIFYIKKTKKYQKLIKDKDNDIKNYKEVVIAQEELLDIYRQSVKRYETILKSQEDYEKEMSYLDNIEIEIETYTLDDILIEISKKGINNISEDKILYLKNYNGNK